MSTTVTVETARFGTIRVEESDLIEFPGVPGFPQARRFAVLQHDSGNVFAWLISVDVPDLALVVTEPWQFFPDYRPEIDGRHLRALGVETRDALDLLVVVSVRGSDVTLNLAAPVLVNGATRRGMQVILEDDRYPVRQALPPVEAAEASPTGGEPGPSGSGPDEPEQQTG